MPRDQPTGTEVNLKYFQRRSLKTKVTLFTLGIFVVSIWSLAFYASQISRGAIARLSGDQQYSTVTFMGSEVHRQVDDRLRALNTVANSISPEMLANPQDLQRHLEQRPVFGMYFNGGVYVTSGDGTAIASLPVSAQRIGVNYMDRDYIRIPLEQGIQAIGQPVMGRQLKAPIFGMSAPVRDAQGKVIGALAGVIDLTRPNFLDSISQGRYGKTGDYFIVNAKNRTILATSDKRRLLEVLPPPGVSPWIDRFVQGYEGSAVVVNPLGVEVLVSIKQVPVAGWYLSAILPTTEAFSLIRDLRSHLLAAAGLMTVLAGLLTWWMLSRQLSPLGTVARMLAKQSGSDQPAQPLPVTRQDEIGSLIGGFNRLLETLRLRDEALRATATRLRSLTEMSSDFFWETDAEHRISTRTESRREISESVFRQAPSVGLRRWEIPSTAPDEAGWKAHRDLLDAHLPFRNFEVTRPRSNGRIHHISVSGDPVFDADGHFKGYQGIGTDLTAQKAAESQIRNLAFYDPLTALPNRRLLMDRLKHAMATHSRHARKGALLFVDLDNFKTLNDTLGHDTGDLLLQQIANGLSACVREGDTVARLGGDEFVVMLEDLSESLVDAATQAKAVGEKILLALNKSYKLGNYEHHSTPSIGITLFGEADESLEEPLKRADLAMYQAKASGRNTMRFFDPQMQEVVTQRAALQLSLIEALEKSQFLLHYQAQVDAAGQLIGVEVLVRWRHPDRGLVPPGEFIALAEETGMILRLGHWVLETACAQLAVWEKLAPGSPLARISMSVNVSPRQFHQDDFVAQVGAIFARTGVNPRRLKLELTEGMLVANIEEVIVKMKALKQQGVGFSLDDFGTGYSSLSHLKRLPLDQLKIDQSFVRDILTDANDVAIAKMVIALGDSLGLSVIAEGVETIEQRHFLARHGCHAYQGYLFGRPMPVADFEATATWVKSEPSQGIEPLASSFRNTA